MTVDQKILDGLSHGFVDHLMEGELQYSPRFIANLDDLKVVGALKEELSKGGRFVFSVAFITKNAISMLKQSLFDYSGKGIIITSDYQNFNHPDVFRELLKFKNIEVRIFTGQNFHPKGYVFYRDKITSFIVGSSNLTDAALSTNHEWNVQFAALKTGALPKQISETIDYQLAHSESLTSEWIKHYEAVYHVQARYVVPVEAKHDEVNNAVLIPNEMQTEALAKIKELRDSGESKALIVSATGTGKTILSAFDVAAFGPKKMLYLVHREQILDKAITEFSRVLGLGANEFGKLTGNSRVSDKRFIFATVQTLSKPDILGTFGAKEFDYILIDEVHRSGAASYQRVLGHFEPQFLLGMTATPERTDGINIFQFFDYNVPYEIRLSKALEQGMLSPFHYYGVTDYETDTGKPIEDTSNLSQLIASERLKYLLDTINKYRQEGVVTKGLIFCRRNEEASALALDLSRNTFSSGKRIKALAVSGSDSQKKRENAIFKLESGEVDYLVSVDIFNEGIDIPSVNQVVMLRETKSSIVFVQQLGRGLRKHPGKDSLIVIDFIGNYKNNYLIPIALFGDTTLNKDSLRKKLVGIKTKGVISGVSSVSFDEISERRIFASIESTSLNTKKNLESAYLYLKNMLNRIPMLQDFLSIGSVDPVVIATKRKSYIELVYNIEKQNLAIPEVGIQFLRFICNELLNGKRPHELLILKNLLTKNIEMSNQQVEELLIRHKLVVDTKLLTNIRRVLTFEFYRKKGYGTEQILSTEFSDSKWKLSDSFYNLFKNNQLFAKYFMDALNTGLAISAKRYDFASTFIVGAKYSRKDACRLLGFPLNENGNVFGYKVHVYTKSCPIFVTYHKRESISESTKYGDRFLDQTTMRWFTRAYRRLESEEVKRILDPLFTKHLFVKKNDGEGKEFYYLGQVSASDAKQTQQPEGEGKFSPIVVMNLGLESPVEYGLYKYLTKE